MATIAELNNKIKTANALGIENLSKKGVTISESATTYEIMQSIDNISSGTSGDDSYNQGYVDGQKEYEQWFWDIYQRNGNREDHQYAFAGIGWTDETLKPKYDMQPTYASRMFANALITDLKGILETLGITLDFSKSTSAIELLANSHITSIGVVDTNSMSNLNQVFYQAKKLKNIDKLILKEDGSQTFSSSLTFGYCNSLTHIIVEGTIGQNNFNIQWSDLNKESLLSILNALQDKTSDTSGTEWKIKIGNINKEKLTGEELSIADNKGWSVE